MSITENMDESTDAAAAAPSIAQVNKDATMTTTDEGTSEPPASTTNNGSTNDNTTAASAAVPPFKTEESPPTNNNNELDNDDEEEEEEIIDEEDNLFLNLEKEQQLNEQQHIHDAQPHDATAAPKLLQAAIQKGEVGLDESEAESEEEHKKMAAAASSSAAASAADEKKEDDGGEHHVHHRVSNRVRGSDDRNRDCDDSDMFVCAASHLGET